MAHIQNTLAKKQLVQEALDIQAPLKKYRELVAGAKARGFDNEAIAAELEDERARITHDIRCGDSLFLKGVENAQSACIVAIDKILSELKGEN